MTLVRHAQPGELMQADIELDVRGYNCPIPLLRARKALAQMEPGKILKVLTTDPGAEIDFKVFAEASGNDILALEQTSDLVTLYMVKGKPRANDPKRLRSQAFRP